VEPTGKPATFPELGLMQGSPAPADKLVTLSNWQAPPFNRWAFLHIRELIPTARISRGEGPIAEAERDLRPIDHITFEFQDRSWTVAEMLDATYTDGLLVMHEGRVIDERYVDGMVPRSTHLLQSVSKSITSTVVGALQERGVLTTQDLVTAHVEELRGGPFEGCTVQHLLDMRAGLKWSEDYEDDDADVCVYEELYNWRPRSHPELPPDAYGYMASLSENVRPHGGVFDYRSVLTDVLGWVIERAGGAPFAELCSNEVWSKLGARYDAEVTVGPNGCAMEDGGICTTLGDLARFGQMQLNEGLAPGGRVVPADWVRGCTAPDPELLDAFATSPDNQEFPGAMYHNKWWVLDPDRGVHTGLGIYGQQLLIHPPARAVIAKFSTQPEAWNAEREALQVNGTLAICEALVRGDV